MREVDINLIQGNLRAIESMSYALGKILAAKDTFCLWEEKPDDQFKTEVTLLEYKIKDICKGVESMADFTNQFIFAAKNFDKRLQEKKKEEQKKKEEEKLKEAC